MIELMRAGCGFCLQFLVFFVFGSVLMKTLKMKQDSSMAVILGYLLYFSIFELIVVPMTLLWVPLHAFSVCWGILLIVVWGIGTVLMRKQWAAQCLKISEVWKEHSWMLLLATAVIVFQCVVVALYQDTTADAAYYVGTVSTSVYTGTMCRYNPYTGSLLKEFEERYVFSGYPMHNAVWCELLGIHPIVQSKTVMSVMNVLVANLIIYQIGKRLFDNNKKKADMMVCFVCLLQLFTNTIYTSGTFFFTRAYEGKSLLANIAIPAVLYCSIWFWKEEERNMWIMLFLSSLSAVCFSGSSIILLAAIAAGIFPMLWQRKNVKKVIPLCICMIPEVLYFLLYYGTKTGWFVFHAS